MYKSVIFMVLIAFVVEMGCQNGHKQQSWAPKQHKPPGTKRK
jgi:hypothetical protein